MSPIEDRSDETLLQPDDLAMLSAIQRGNEWLRAILCTLARRGVAFRLANPGRAQQILRILSRLPLYKGGQFLFDLLEWEDLMLDGPPPAVVPTTLDASSLKRIAALLNSIQAHLDGSTSDDSGLVLEIQPSSLTVDQDLPPLEPGFYLYQDVVLGLLESASPLLLASNQPKE